MEQNNFSKEKFTCKFPKIFENCLRFLLRWFFIILLILAGFFCVFVWYRYIFRAEWDESKKQEYINEQAKFSFNKAGYQKVLEMINTRKEKFDNFPAFSGKDIFSPNRQ